MATFLVCAGNPSKILRPGGGGKTPKRANSIACITIVRHACIQVRARVTKMDSLDQPPNLMQKQTLFPLVVSTNKNELESKSNVDLRLL
jgi:hypothetical protein